MKNKILVANRGEIAIRIIRAAKELGIETVAIYSTADQDSLHVKLADESICVGGNSSKESYLNMNHVLSAAISTGCNAIHPGYGFLSENHEFVEMVESCQLKFIGPKAKTIAMIGDKASARKIAKANGVPIIEGSDGIIESFQEGLKIAKRIGYPVMIKASSGGGGRGISIVRSNEEFLSAFERTSLEALTSFGDQSLYIEKYIEAPRHIEIQLIADTFGNIVHLFERDCSMQRRNQKMIEEAPSPILNDVLRKKICAAAIKIAKAIGYINAGTIEFLIDNKGNYYFIEMNTRIQVEHPITEIITGIDLVKEQIRIAYGNELSFKQKDLKINGHAIECRINAEDAFNGFAPSPGKITNILFPGGNGVRIDTHIFPGYEVPPFYDSMLAKLIVHAPTRKEAIKKMRVALEQFVVEGISTNIEYQYLIMHNTSFIKGQYDTGFITRFNTLVEAERRE
ncbi:MAG: acetyl-CoA carboxylase biotin carboxylase subunit [Acholeplasmataceae bacterium]|nr:acetyl-CoA carboxylase biotin carboxylase subunit [Acholeplasmataceae bacterium]